MTELLTGLSIGLAAGISPGPLQTLVVTSTLSRGFGAGVRVAIAPLVTDTPIVTLALLVVAAISAGAVRSLAIAGGVLVLGMGLWELRSARAIEDEGTPNGAAAAGDVARGALVNLVSPHPWLFWVTAGAPLLVTAWRTNPAWAIAFLAGFYTMLVGSKVALAGVVAAGRSRLSVTWRRRLVVAGGLLLVAGGTLLIVRAW